jgi:DTW domain-containing protein YfiP
VRRCYTCFRKTADCFCAAIPRIHNQTDVLILQHVRERFHPFNTARIVRQSLARSRLLRTYAGDRSIESALRPRAALLYPGPQATLLDELPDAELPEQLVIVDGTWHQAKTLVRDNPALAELPRYGLAPASPSRYRIRREPTAASLSTLEATVFALRVLEPRTDGFDQLLAAFDTMVERQLAHPKSATGARRLERRRPTSWNIPSALLGDLRHIVVCYGESAPKEEVDAQAPLYWVAERLGSGERFARLIRPDFAISDGLLGHLELSRQDLLEAVSTAEARKAWAAFRQPGDVLAVYNPGVARQLVQLDPDGPACLVLKSVYLGGPRAGATLDDQLRAEGVTPLPAAHPGRAGKRLANLAAWVRCLNTNTYGQIG